jgi:hypothetical protein
VSKIEKLVKKALEQTFLDGYERSDPRAAQAIVAALVAAGALNITENTK